MPFLSILGNLLGGATEEAAKVHKERFDQEQADRNYSSNILLHLIDDPSIGNPAIKEEALQELHGRMLDHSLDNYTHKPGKLGKLVDQFVGMTRPQGPLGPMSKGGAVPAPQEQTGTGRGNATSSVGGANPPPQAAAQQSIQDASSPAAGGPLPPPPGGNTLGTSLPQGITTPSGFMDADAAATRDANRQAVLDKVKFQRDYQTKLETWQWLKKNDPTLKDISPEEEKLEHARFMYNMVTPVSYLKQSVEPGESIPQADADAEAARLGLAPPPKSGTGFIRRVRGISGVTSYEPGEPPRPVEVPNSLMPGSPSGVGASFFQKGDLQNPVAQVPTQTGKPGEQQYYNSLVTKKGSALTPEEYRAAHQEWVSADAGGRLPSQEALATFRGDISKDVGSASTARREITQVYKPYRDAQLLFSNMQDAYNRVHSGKSTAIGADDMILLSNHIAMTFGAVPGARTGRDIIEAHRDAIAAFPRLQRAVNSVLSGDRLEEGQRKEFLHAAQDRLSEINTQYEKTKDDWGFSPPGEPKKDITTPAPAQSPANLSFDDFKKWQATQPKK